MKYMVSMVRTALHELWSLLVDDGFLAVAALIAIGAAYVLSRDSIVGPRDIVGWALIAALIISMAWSLRRFIATLTRKHADP